MKALRTACIATGCVLLLGLTSWVTADSLNIELNKEFSGAQSPVGSKPWLVANFNGENGVVDVTLTSYLTGSEFVRGEAGLNEKGKPNGNLGWGFNLDPSINLDSVVVGGMDVGNVQLFKFIDGFKADGDGYFDLALNFSPDFTAGTVLHLQFTSSDLSFKASSFNYYSAPGGGNGQYRSAAHVQGIGDNAGGSGWIGDSAVVPLPTAVWSGMMLLGGLAGLDASKRMGRAC